MKEKFTMATATRKSQTKAARTRTEQPRQKSKRQHTPALERVLPYAEKQRLMVLETLREECGRELANDARFNGEEFDWTQFNAEFRRDYAHVSLKQLMAYARNKYGLRTLDDVRDRRASHKKVRSQRIANAGGSSNGYAGYESDDESEMNEDFDMDDFDIEE
jgi:hypothetical protein